VNLIENKLFIVSCKHPDCKKRAVGCCCGYVSGSRCRFAYGPADATATHCLLRQ